jgi:hypothetical protein
MPVSVKTILETGLTGAQGFQGNQGNTGAQGAQGAQGSQGAQGAQGAQGRQGADSTVAGPQGPQGRQGATGPQGAQGNQGSTGSLGPTGPQGAQGAQGAQGTNGTIGTNGAQGPQGAQGFQGTTGTTGPQGNAGSLGPTGPQGPQGALGAGTITDDTSTNATYYPSFANATSGTFAPRISSSKLTFNPSTGTLSATNVNSLSDETFKYEIKNINDALAVIEQIQGIEFKWKDNNLKSYGVGARQIESVIPEIVSTDVNGRKTVNYSAILPFVIESIKILNNKINSLDK